MKTKLFPKRYYMAAFWLLALLLFGKAHATPYQDASCDHRNVFTLKAKVSHDNSRCANRNVEQPHAFIGVHGLILHESVVNFMKAQNNSDLFLFYSAIITGNEATLDIPLVNEEQVNLRFYENYTEPDLDSFYLLLYTDIKPPLSGSYIPPLSGNFNDVSLLQTGISPIPINGYVEFPTDRPVLVRLKDILSCKLVSTSGCEKLEIEVETKCPLVLEKAETIYSGYPYRIRLKASANCTQTTFTATPNEYPAFQDFTYSSGMFSWQYTYADTNIHLPLQKKGTDIVFSPSDFTPKSMGKNVVMNLVDGRAMDSRNSKRICFYPDLPQPVKNRFQRIPESSDYLDVLRLYFNRSFNASKEETPTLLTLYSQVAQKSDGSINTSESKVIFQEAFDLNKLNGTTYTTSVANKKIREGTYYVTVEGTVRGKSNLPGENAELPADIRNTIFQVIPIVVGKNDFEVENAEFTPPTCHGGKGKLKLTLGAYFLPNVSKYPVFYYRTNPESSGEPTYDTIHFRCTYSGFVNNAHATFECDHITARHTHFKIVIPPMVSTIPGGGISIGGGSLSVSEGVTPKAAIGSSDTYNDLIAYFSLDFTQPEPLQLPVEVKHLSGYYCMNGTSTMADDGQVTVFRSEASGGTAPYTFSFRDDYINPSFTGLASDIIPAYSTGYRYIRMLDRNSCRFDTTVFVSRLNVKLCAGITTERAISCYNANDGILSVSTETRNTDALTYAWYKNNTLMPGKTGHTLTDLGPGKYKVVVTETKTGMSSYDEVTLTQPTELKLNVQQQVDVDCFGDKTGMLALSGSGGVPSYLYLWNGVSYGSLRRNLAAGTYQVKLIDQNSCEITKTYTITQPESAFEIAIDSVVHAHFGQNDEYIPGKILLHPQGGTKPYGPLNGIDADLEKLDAGTYRMQQHDAKNCTDEKEVEIEVYDKMRIHIVQERHNLCFGENNAACRVVIEGGVPPFKILWSNGQTQSEIKGLWAGNYSVRVEDAAAVVRTATIEISQPGQLSVDSLLVKHPAYHGCSDTLCPPNERDGEIHFAVSGGRTPYLFSWTKDGEAFSLPPTQTDIGNLTAGSYLLTARDHNGCTVRKNFVLNETASLKVRISLLQSIDCHGNPSGVLQAEVSGGTPPYRYFWENLPDTSQVAGNLPAGTHTVRVEDALGVRAQASFELQEPDPLRILVQNIVHPSYPGSRNAVVLERKNNGEIQTYAEGGTTPYRFSWRRNEIPLQTEEPLLKELSDGVYRLQLSDKAGCTADTVFILPFTEALLCSVRIEKPVSCSGMSDAQLNALIQGGKPPYAIHWIENGNDTTGRSIVLDKRKSGSYTLSVADSNNVTASYEIHLPQPDSLILKMEGVSSLCHRDSSGLVSAIVQGGTWPYIYQWVVDGEKLQNRDSVLSKLENAHVLLHLTDTRGCAASASLRITAPEALELTHTVSPPSYQSSLWQECKEEQNDGFIELHATGGTAPYRYLWGNGEEGRVLEHLDSGTYHVVLKDRNGCRLERDIRMDRTRALLTELRIINEPLCADSPSASFALSVQGGKKPYTFDWYKDDKWFGGDSSLIKTGMSAGTYKIFLRDANGMVSKDSLLVREPERLSIRAEIEDATAWTIPNGSIRLGLQGGTPPYRTFWSNGARETQLQGLKRGIYQADILDTNQCLTSVAYLVNSPDSLFISSAALQHCDLENPTGVIRLSVQGGMKPYRYDWKDALGNLLLADSGRGNLMQIEGLAPGIYRFSLSDAGGAELEQLFRIEEKRRLEASLLLENPIHCHGESNAVIQAWIRGGKEPYRCLWEGIPDSLENTVRIQAGNTRIENLPAGTYVLKVQDAENDSCSVSISITQAEALSLHAEIYPAEDSSGLYDGLFVLRAQGGHPPYRYLWNTGNSQSEQHFLRAQRYDATVTDAEGCTAFINLDSVVSRNLRIRLNQTAEILCFGEQTGGLEVSVVNGKPPFEIEWSNGHKGTDMDSLGAGRYSVTVTDAYGRIDSGSFLIRQPERMQNLITVQEPSCNGYSNGNIQIQTSGGHGHYAYAWSTGAYTAGLSHLPRGTYVVRVSDRRQCILIDTVVLNEPEELACHLQIDSIICPDEKGRILWSAQGGTLPYSHEWNLIGENGTAEALAQGERPIISPASAGHYRIRVQDGHNCRLDTAVLLVNPLPVSYTLPKERSLCAGQVLELKAEGCDSIANLQYLWIYPDGKVSQEAEISTQTAGLHRLTIIQNNLCIYRDSVNVIPFSDSIRAEFWVSSQITARQSCLLVNLSGYSPDSIVWHIPQNVKILNREGNYLEIQFPASGIYTVGLTSFKGLCQESFFRQIEVFDEQQKFTGEAEQTSIRWLIAPNPTNSTCLLTGQSDRSLPVRYRIVHAGTGKVLEQGRFELTEGRVSQSLFKGDECAGMYILLLEYGYEKRSFKLVKL